MPTKPETPPSAPPETFEQGLAELEALVARMEDGKLPLEESLAAYQRGAELLRYCESKLADAQARIAILEGEALRDFNPGSK
jgi:exodeoxyribonuclease VII small subunit